LTNKILARRHIDLPTVGRACRGRLAKAVTVHAVGGKTVSSSEGMVPDNTVYAPLNDTDVLTIPNSAPPGRIARRVAINEYVGWYSGESEEAVKLRVAHGLSMGSSTHRPPASK
jgi:hypothetical protein